MHRTLIAALGLALSLTVAGCPAADDHGHEHGPDADHSHGEEDHGHAHDAGEGDDGVVARIAEVGSGPVGYLRLKLHDDKGDLEAWLVRDADFTQPLDLPLDATLTVTFTDKENRAVTLRVRNREQNEDEDGQPTVREGKTNYFIFPGDTGEDATWLKGADFLSTVKVSYSADGKDYQSPQFVLRPHTHGDGPAH
ncbi:MAG: hypothetical protein R3F62_06120 [Planctomycetota bacterium]